MTMIADSCVRHDINSHGGSVGDEART